MLIMTEYLLAVDTALSTEGTFPEPTANCRTVGIEGPFGYVMILVSSRYTTPDAEDAATIAVDAWDEITESVPWPGMGSPFYHVEVWPAGDPDDSRKVRGIVRSAENGADLHWNYEGEPAEWPAA